MNSSEALISRTTIVILSYTLLQMGIAQRANPPLALHCIFAGTVGFISYLVLQRAAFQKSREIACNILSAWGYPPK